MSYARQAYANTAAVTANPREVEAQALSNSAVRLHGICVNWEERKHELNKALLTNRKIWTVFIDSIMDPSSPHPKELREKILNIGIVATTKILIIGMIATTKRGSLTTREFRI